MANVNPVGGSRLNQAELLTEQGITFWDSEKMDIVAHQDDGKYQVAKGDRIDFLAYRTYGKSPFWWVIASANNMALLPTEVIPGMIITIPNAYSVLSQL